jgi:predicted dehydrogenase
MNDTNKNRSKPNRKGLVNRRRFIAGAAGTALSFTIVQPESVRGTQANSKLKLGLIGCGGRGTWIAELFQNHGGYEITAAADYFQDRVTAFGDKFNVPASSRFTTLSGYLRLLEQKLDAVAIESPPYFHPEQAAAAVDAGCHTYLAKPVAVDVAGCRLIAETGRNASQKKLCFLVDFQTRADQLYREALKRTHQGAIGTFVFGQASYHADNPWKGQIKYLRDDPNEPESRLRAWGLNQQLSGDIIIEQNIHTIDVMSWIMDKPPISAVATHGRKVRTLGTCSDHFTALFEYPDGVGITFSSRQFNGHGTHPEGIRNRMFGSEGVLETEYGGQVLIRGKNFYHGGQTSDIYKQGAVANIAEFYDSIRKGNFENPTVAPSARSNLVTILARTAAYKAEKIYWDRLLTTAEKFTPDLKGLKK